MSACGSGHVMPRTCPGPSVDEFPCTDRKLRTHVGVTECEDQAFLILTFRDNEFEVAVSVLCNAQICDRADRRIELRQIAAACLAMEDRDHTPPE